MINISESAAKKIENLKQEDGMTIDAFLRVYVEEGGCSGFNYKLDFDTNIKDNDKSFESHGTKVIVDSKSLLYLLGMTLDFEGGLNGSGFIFNNPNATKKCNCGTSFAV